MKQITASSAYLSIPEPLGDPPRLGCSWWRRDSVEWDQTGPSEYAALGTAFHDAAEAYSIDGNADGALQKHRDKPWYDSLRRRFNHWLSWWKSLPLSTTSVVHVEVPLRFDPFSGEASVILGQKSRRDYSMLSPATEVGGTADVIISNPEWDYPVVVYDYKTGDQPVPASSPQMLLLGLMAAKVFKTDIVRTVVVTVHEDGVWEDGYNLCSKRLDAVQRALAMALSEGEDCQPNPSADCRYCPARKVCPAVNATLEVVKALKPDAAFRFSTELLSPDHAAWTAEMLPLAEEFVDRVRLALKSYADENEGIALPFGREYSGADVDELRPSLTREAMTFLNKSGAEKAIRRSTSWSAIEEAVGKEQARDIRDAFLAKGWVSQGTKRVYRIRKRQK